MVREISLTGPDGQTRTVPLDRDRISVGRAPENDLPFPEDIGLSRHHLLF